MRSRSNRILAVILSLLVVLAPLRGVFAAPADTFITSEHSAHTDMMVAAQSSGESKHACFDGADTNNNCCQNGVDCVNHCMNIISVITSNSLATSFIHSSHPHIIHETLHANVQISALYRPPRA